MIFSIILFVAGVVFLAWNKVISRWLYHTQLPGFKLMFGELFNGESEWFYALYRWAIIFSGFALLIGACANYFGPVVL
jgi:hypothetical protein